MKIVQERKPMGDKRTDVKTRQEGRKGVYRSRSERKKTRQSLPSI
jgi:hypothetical protein